MGQIRRSAFAGPSGAVLALAALAAGCPGGDPRPDGPKAAVPDDADAAAARALGACDFLAARKAWNPFEAKALALRSWLSFSRAAARAPSPANRFLAVRAALLVDPLDETARADLESIVASAPDAPLPLAQLALLQASDPGADLSDAYRKAKHAVEVAAVAADREVRWLVGEHACAVAVLAARKDPVGASELVVAASRLGSTTALENLARMYSEARGRKVDRPRALELAQQAADTAFTDEEKGRVLLTGSEATARHAARMLAHMLVQEARFEDALPLLERGLADDADAALPSGDPDPQFDGALAELGQILAEGLAGKRDRGRGRRLLARAASHGHVPSVVELGRLAADSGSWPLGRAESLALFACAASGEHPSLPALACLGCWETVGIRAAGDVTTARTPPEKLYALRTSLVAIAVQRGPAGRAPIEEAARDAASKAPENEPAARQLRHIAGDLSAADLQATMPKSALLPRWRAETELALATRCVLVGDRAGAREHLLACLAAGAVTSIEDPLAWAMLRALP